MDLNAIPGDDEQNFVRQLEGYSEPVERIESAIDIAFRERDERRKRPRKQRSDDRNQLLLPPSGWLDCPSFGEEIGHYFIPSKVPLGERFNDHILPGKRYSFKQLIREQRELGRKIGLVIDLTNTTRYYKAADLKKEEAGIEHVKIACVGRDSVPSNAQVNEFVHEVSRFLSSRREHHPKRHILVHCTHGHNRTGYMIIHFLMRTTMPSISVRQAVKSFAEARHPGIYKPDYITALYDFYHEEKPENFTCPSTPEWKRSSSSGLDPHGKEPLPDEDDDGNLAAPVQDNCEKELRMSNDDILGDDIPTEQAQCFRAFCYQTFKLRASLSSQFPGSHPVSLNREKLQLLRQRYYYATWKADGTRYMMLITVDGCYLIDRSFNFRRVQMRFPCRSTDEGRTGEKTHHYTLLDGEMVIDTITTPDSHLKHQERRYLIYDLMAINQVSVVELPFHERWKMIEKEIIEPRNYERRHNIRNNPYYRYDFEPFRVRRKDFWLLSTVAKLLKGFIPKLSHDADGLIFQGWDDPYVPRTHEGLLKWKYPEMNSVDFLFEVGEEEDNHQHLFLYERGKKKLMEAGKRVVVFGDGSDPSLYSGKIIECCWDSDERVWLCMRERVDKSTPNEFNTYRKVMRSINDNITEDILLSEINEIIGLPMYADRMKQESKHIDLARRR